MPRKRTRNYTFRMSAEDAGILDQLKDLYGEKRAVFSLALRTLAERDSSAIRLDSLATPEAAPSPRTTLQASPSELLEMLAPVLQRLEPLVSLVERLEALADRLEPPPSSPQPDGEQFVQAKQRLGNYLKSWRTLKRLSQREMSENLCVSLSSYIMWESGQFAPRSEDIRRRIVELTGFPPEEMPVIPYTGKAQR